MKARNDFQLQVAAVVGARIIPPAPETLAEGAGYCRLNTKKQDFLRLARKTKILEGNALKHMGDRIFGLMQPASKRLFLQSYAGE